MEKFVINGKNPLSGEIEVRGAKNAVMKILPAALLSKGTITIKNLPNIEEIHKATDILKDLGASIKLDGRNCTVSITEIKKNILEPEFANKFRSSVMFAGPLLAQTGEVRFPHPGGCVIGAGKRPIDLFLDGFVALGAEVEENDDYYVVKAKKLIGGNYFFTTASVTGTESMIMTAVLAEGVTTLGNCAMEPEIVALADYLNKNGAKILGAGTSTVIIEGVKEISAGEYTIIPDRIETGTFAILGAATKSELTITKCNPNNIESLLAVFQKVGISYERGEDWLKIKPAKSLRPIDIKTHEYPGFPTDLQPPYTVLMTQAEGRSVIHEVIYDRRLLFTDMLVQMGADIIMCDPHRIVVNGPTKLHGRKLTSPDLRAGIAVVIAAALADGQTEIDNIYQIDRGYEKIEERLQKIGVKIERVNE
ncbi:UDP-N-acetylglucosamine 1-carboxyvinyltransferase [Patescibacteria group bacterium]|nr:UDP-N-acetylglucosamine 1-carboxyvinyltransferase [Patescibacteria group bacterium]MBU1074452.1 UDP-N-acetylglucosamine 1-carboxyvinyltransferase [Patescibacteria group bacterium]MBU1952105.1 UDP-N-acetylglucosamine 1-carboxyvinyltransferase [Patescibacteria group bacterium]